MSPPRAAVFDLDGTLIDSVPDIAAALNAALAEVRIAPFGEADVARMVGHGARALIERALTGALAARDGGGVEVERVLSAFTRHYAADPCRLTRPYPGTLDALALLEREGWRLGVCTNKPEALTHRVLDGLGLSAYFGAVVGGSDRLPLKPAPDMLAATVAALDVAPGRAVMIGDGPADAGAAAAAGLPAILLRHGYSSEPLETLPAAAVIDGFAGLAGALVTIKFPG